jgi:hypothetical protein
MPACQNIAKKNREYEFAKFEEDEKNWNVVDVCFDK